MSTSPTASAPTASARRPMIAVLVPVAGAVVAAGALLWASQPWRGGAALDPFALVMFGLALLPHVLVAFALVFGRAVGWLWWTALAYGVLISATGIVLDIEILTDDSSTAVLGFLFLPVYQLLGMIPAAVAGVLVGEWSRRRRPRGSGG